VKLQFDPNQQFQLDAVSAIVYLFDGQPQGALDYSVIDTGNFGGMFATQAQTELGVGNQLLLSEEVLRTNTRKVQMRNDIEVANETTPLESWELFDLSANISRRCPHFSVEMETGTGKTYVYLRTIFELSRVMAFKSSSLSCPVWPFVRGS
jgi:type III restriction enzyme